MTSKSTDDMNTSKTTETTVKDNKFSTMAGSINPPTTADTGAHAMTESPQPEASAMPPLQPAADTVDNTIKNYVIASMAVGLAPLPMADILGLMAIHLKMVDSLGRHYGVPFSIDKARPLILPLVAGAVPVTLTFLAASMIKAMPGFGSLAGGATNSVSGGAITYAVGRVFNHHFSQGGTLEDFDPIGLRDRFRKEMKDGEAVAGDLQGQPAAA